jgi:UDP-2-acetamido-3-amino-2,3-dideoxy-glucuronate N-acetyltransferase
MGIADVTTTHLSFPSNVRAHIFVSWLHPFKEHRFVVVGSEGMVVFDDTRDWPEKLVLYPHGITWEDGQAPVARRADALQVKLTEEEPLRAECEDFIRAIMTRQEALVSASTGVQVLDVLERAERVLGGHPAPVLRAPSADVFIHPTAVVDEDVHIGDRTKIWHYGHLSSGAAIGNDSSLGQNVYVGPGVVIGNRVRVQNNVSVYEGVELEDGVFCGPSMVFTNVRTPRAEVQRSDAFAPTLVRQGATLGANSTILCGTTIGRFAMVGAGAVVTRDVADHALVVGVPAKRIGWVCSCGERIDGNGRVVCGRCRRAFLISKDALHPNEEASGS